jgi:predicted PolB exonuclease-like 3'-5' exonuclease
MPSDKLVTTDFESIPDVDLAEYLTGYQRDPRCDDAEDLANRIKALDAYSREKNHTPEGEDAPMLPPALNKIVTAGVHIAEIKVDPTAGEWYETKHLTSTSDPEPQIIVNLLNWFERMQPRFVTYNGRSFDFPLLAGRALKYNLPMAFWFNTGDKWNSYTNRYSQDWHFDVMDFLSQFGATNRMKLREVMALLKLPDKVYNGSKVLDLWLAGKMGDAREYCEMDCIATFVSYVQCQRMRGVVSEQGRNASLLSLIKFLMSHRDQVYVMKFMLEWCSLDPWVRAQCPELFTSVMPPVTQ